MAESIPNDPIQSVIEKNIIDDPQTTQDDLFANAKRRRTVFTLGTLPEFNYVNIIRCLSVRERLTLFNRICKKFYNLVYQPSCFVDMSFFPILDESAYVPRILAVTHNAGITYVEVNVKSDHPFITRVASVAGMWNFKAEVWQKLEWSNKLCIESLQLTLENNALPPGSVLRLDASPESLRLKKDEIRLKLDGVNAHSAPNSPIRKSNDKEENNDNDSETASLEVHHHRSQGVTRETTVDIDHQSVSEEHKMNELTPSMGSVRSDDRPSTPMDTDLSLDRSWTQSVRDTSTDTVIMHDVESQPFTPELSSQSPNRQIGEEEDNSEVSPSDRHTSSSTFPKSKVESSAMTLTDQDLIMMDSDGFMADNSVSSITEMASSSSAQRIHPSDAPYSTFSSSSTIITTTSEIEDPPEKVESISNKDRNIRTLTTLNELTKITTESSETITNKLDDLKDEFKMRNLFFIRFDTDNIFLPHRLLYSHRISASNRDDPVIYFPKTLHGMGLQGFGHRIFQCEWWVQQCVYERRFEQLRFLVLAQCTFQKGQLQDLLRGIRELEHLSLRYVDWEGLVEFPESLLSIGFFPHDTSDIQGVDQFGNPISRPFYHRINSESTTISDDINNHHGVSSHNGTNLMSSSSSSSGGSSNESTVDDSTLTTPLLPMGNANHNHSDGVTMAMNQNDQAQRAAVEMIGGPADNGGNGGANHIRGQRQIPRDVFERLTTAQHLEHLNNNIVNNNNQDSDSTAEWKEWGASKAQYSLAKCNRVFQVHTRLHSLHSNKVAFDFLNTTYETCRDTVKRVSVEFLQSGHRLAHQSSAQERASASGLDRREDIPDLDSAFRWKECSDELFVHINSESLSFQRILYQSIFKRLPTENIRTCQRNFDFFECPHWSKQATEFIQMTKDRKLLLR